MRDVAQKAGVSITSVSHVINKTRFVAPGLKKRIFDAMRDLHYRPNRLAQGLRNKRSFTLGLILPDITNPYFAEIARDIENASFKQGYSIIICNSDQDSATESRYMEVLTDKQVDGVILVDVGSRSPKALAPLSTMPLIMLDREVPELPTDSIQADNAEGGRVAAEHLLSLRHRRFACIAGPEVIQPGDNRLVGFKEALEKAGAILDESQILRGDFRSESAYRLALEILEWKTMPTAIFAFNDLMAFGAITALSERGMRVPEDISVVGYDNIEQASYFNPRLTTVAQPHREMGEMAVAKLIERIAEKDLPARVFHLSPCLVTRNSTAPARNRRED
jgi:LacI family transcriptional regulator